MLYVGARTRHFFACFHVATPACTNGVWPPLRPASVTQKNKLSTMLSSNVQPIDLLMHYTAWRFWTMRQPNGCSTPALRSSAAKQWFEQLAQKKKNVATAISGQLWVATYRVGSGLRTNLTRRFSIRSFTRASKTSCLRTTFEFRFRCNKSSTSTKVSSASHKGRCVAW